ncbi:hypothetical protein KQI21_00825 [Virgibacillus proomii]|nr:hypothetical protein [Virgibacillus proomii]
MTKLILRITTTCLIIIGIIIGDGFLISNMQASTLFTTTGPKEQNGGIIPLIWIVIIVGGCIGITLTYVSWRKYKGEAEKRNKQDKTVD